MGVSEGPRSWRAMVRKIFSVGFTEEPTHSHITLTDLCGAWTMPRSWSIISSSTCSRKMQFARKFLIHRLAAREAFKHRSSRQRNEGFWRSASLVRLLLWFLPIFTCMLEGAKIRATGMVSRFIPLRRENQCKNPTQKYHQYALDTMGQQLLNVRS